MANLVSIGYICSMNKKIRYSGILLHPTSLPNGDGIGDIGKEAFRFVDLLSQSQVGVWQMLPLGPVGFGNSPYASLSAYGGNELLINLDNLVEMGLLENREVTENRLPNRVNVNFKEVEKKKIPLLFKAVDRFQQKASQSEKEKFEQFCKSENHWLVDYALFRTLKEHYNDSRWFSHWAKEHSQKESEALNTLLKERHEEIERWKIVQYLFYSQWRALKTYANRRGVLLMGDIPIYVAHDSVDAWSNQRILLLNKDGSLKASSGVPPDAYSSTGQLWGNPLYNWKVLEEENFQWWIERLEHQFQQTDLVRIDHFRGFEAFWMVPGTHTTAEKGRWVKAPGVELFNVLHKRWKKLPVIAEDLGVITKEVEQLRDSNRFAGMRVAHFAFNPIGNGRLDPANPYLPHNYPEHTVAYTGTHDNNTTKGWYESLDGETKDVVRRYLSCSDEQVAWHLMRAVIASRAQFAIIPMQDLLMLDSSARMNLPGTCNDSNWSWRLSEEQLSSQVGETLLSLFQPFGRSGTFSDFNRVEE